MVKSFIKLYLIQYHKNAFHDELSISVYSMLEMKLQFPDSVKILSQISALGSLLFRANKKGVYLEKKISS